MTEMRSYEMEQILVKKLNLKHNIDCLLEQTNIIITSDFYHVLNPMYKDWLIHIQHRLAQRGRHVNTFFSRHNGSKRCAFGIRGFLNFACKAVFDMESELFFVIAEIGFPSDKIILCTHPN